MENQYREEITIDLMHMVFFLLNKWKTMVALVLVCAVIGGGYAAMQPTVEEQIEEILEDYQPKADMLAQMEDAFRVRSQYEEMLDACLEMELTGDMQQYDAMLASAVRYQSLMTTMEKAFTGDDLTYYQVNFLGTDAPEENTQETVSEVSSASVVKYAAVGGFLGAVLWGMWYLVAYLGNSTVKTAEEMAGSCGITLLGRVATPKKGLFAGLQEKTKRPEAAISYLAAVVDGAQEGQAVLCGDAGCEAVAAVMKDMEAASGKIKATGFISESEEGLKAAKQSQSEILVLKTWDTKRAQVLRELEMCRVQGVKILGMIVVD